MAETVQLAGDFDWQDGESSVTGKLSFTLTKRDFDGPVIIEPRPQEITLDAEGEFSGLQVWPNDRGRSGSRYKVDFTPAGTTRPVAIHSGIIVPELGGPHQLGDLLELADTLAATKIQVLVTMTEAAFEAARIAGSLADGLYLVKVEG